MRTSRKTFPLKKFWIFIFTKKKNQFFLYLSLPLLSAILELVSLKLWMNCRTRGLYSSSDSLWVLTLEMKVGKFWVIKLNWIGDMIELKIWASEDAKIANRVISISMLKFACDALTIAYERLCMLCVTSYSGRADQLPCGNAPQRCHIGLIWRPRSCENKIQVSVNPCYIVNVLTSSVIL